MNIFFFMTVILDVIAKYSEDSATAIEQLNHKKVTTWDTEDVCTWLRWLSFSAEDVSCFNKAGIDGSRLQDLDKAQVTTNQKRNYSETFMFTCYLSWILFLHLFCHFLLVLIVLLFVVASNRNQKVGKQEGADNRDKRATEERVPQYHIAGRQCSSLLRFERV